LHHSTGTPKNCFPDACNQKRPACIPGWAFSATRIQRIDRVEVCCLAGRVEAEKDADGGGEEHGHGD